MDAEKTVLKFVAGFATLVMLIVLAKLLVNWEETWPVMLFPVLCFLIGHTIFKFVEWRERKKEEETLKRWEQAENKWKKEAQQEAVDKAKLEEVRKFSESLQAKQKAEEFERQTKQPWQDHPYLRHTSYNQKNVSVTQNSDTSILPIVVGAVAGYAAGSHASHSSDSSCPSSDSGSSSSDSGSSGGE